jgi:hypothetical protein
VTQGESTVTDSRKGRDMASQFKRQGTETTPFEDVQELLKPEPELGN